MTALELLAPARNSDIGIAAIQSGADAVYIAGPDFGARKAAGNGFEDIERLCDFAHKFGARVFVTFNIKVGEDELPQMHSQMLRAQKAGADAFIIRDTAPLGWDDVKVPLHASTQCAIRDVETALEYQKAGCSRIILERQLSLELVREICSAVDCEVEFFVHGALCVGYSGECTLSEHLTGRSADRGECVQACRSLYDLVDSSGKVLAKDKALLSLKDYNLLDRIPELAGAGVSSFKIEGRLKNASYVKNVVRAYSIALDELVSVHPDKYCRASFGKVSAGFEPDLLKTFNRGYTQLYLDSSRGKWACKDAPKGMGKAVCRIEEVSARDSRSVELRVSPLEKGLQLRNGDGFAFVSGNSITGFRADVCSGCRIVCKKVQGLRKGLILYRNIDTAFEKVLENESPVREIRVGVELRQEGLSVLAKATSEDGRTAEGRLEGLQEASNAPRIQAMLREGLSKRVGHYSFGVSDFILFEEPLPLLSSSQINSLRHTLAESLEMENPRPRPLGKGTGAVLNTNYGKKMYLLRSKYCIRYELGLCPVHQGAAQTGPLYLVNSGRRLALNFDCARCEMSVLEDGSVIQGQN